MENQFYAQLPGSFYSDCGSDGSCGRESCQSGESNFVMDDCRCFDLATDVFLEDSPLSPNPFMTNLQHTVSSPISAFGEVGMNFAVENLPSPQPVPCYGPLFCRPQQQTPCTPCQVPPQWTTASNQFGQQQKENIAPLSYSNNLPAGLQQSDIWRLSQGIWSNKAGAADFQPNPERRPRLSSNYDDALSDLARNGRDVTLNPVDRLLIEMREGVARQRPPSLPDCLENTDRTSPDTEMSLPRKIALIRQKIRNELAEQAARNEARGIYGPRKRDKLNAKKCKFCLKKKEHDDIVTHHNLYDGEGLIACPILQLYKCDVCSATGKHAHTIKYCPYNAPSTPLEVIMNARKQVYLRNRRGL